MIQWFVCFSTLFSSLQADIFRSSFFSAEMSQHDMVCFDKTFEAAEALLHMESPGVMHNERNTGRSVMVCVVASKREVNIQSNTLKIFLFQYIYSYSYSCINYLFGQNIVNYEM